MTEEQLMGMAIHVSAWLFRSQRQNIIDTEEKLSLPPNDPSRGDFNLGLPIEIGYDQKLLRLRIWTIF